MTSEKAASNSAEPFVFPRLITLLLVLATTVPCAVEVRADVPINFVSQWGGRSMAVAVSGNLAYLGVGHRVVIVDITDPATPTVLGQTEPLDGFVHGIAVAGPYAFVAASEAGLVVVDVSDSAAPVQVASVYVGWGLANHVVVSGDYAYVAAGGSGLAIVDVAVPDSPVFLGGYSGSGGDARHVAIDGNYAYVADGFAPGTSSGLLTIIDVSLPDAPTLASTFVLPKYANGVAVSGRYAYVAAWDGGLQVVDVLDPEDPQAAGSCMTDGIVCGVVVLGDYAYVANGFAGLALVDISIPTAPVQAGGLPVYGWSLDIAVSDGHACIAAEGQGMYVFDVSMPPTSSLLGQYRDVASEVTDVEVSGNYLYVSDGGSGGGVQVLDVSNPTDVVRLGGVESHEWSWGITRGGDYVYIADGCAGLGIVDVTDPPNPARLGEVGTDCAARDVVVQGTYAYVARDGGHGLTIVDVSNRFAPIVAGHWEDTPPSGYALGVAVSGSTAYLADAERGLEIIDVSDPENPTRVTRYDTGGYLRDVVVDGGTAYLADEAGGLLLVDVSTPGSPSLIGQCSTFNGSQGVTVAGGYAYVAAGWNGVHIVDLADPANPVRVGQYDTLGFARRLTVQGSRIYVADYDNGLVILDIAVGERVWKNPSDGYFATAENWTPSQVPGPSDHAVVNLAGVYTITMPEAGSVTNDRLVVNGTDVSLDLNGGVYTLTHEAADSASVSVGDDASQPTDAYLTVFSGGIAARDLTVGRYVDNQATLELHVVDWDASLSAFHVGAAGYGSVMLGEGTVSHLTGQLGDAPGSEGSVVVLGDTSSWYVADEMEVGREGDGFFGLDYGSKAEIGWCTLGKFSPGTAQVSVNQSSLLELTRDTDVSLVVGKGGYGAMTVQNGGIVRNRGMMCVAEESGSLGYVGIFNPGDGGGQLTSDYELVVGSSGGEGQVDVDGAGSVLTILGREPGNPGNIVSLELGRWDGHGIMNVTGGGHVNVPYGGEPNTGATCVGGSGPAELTVDGAGSVFDEQFWMDVGRDAHGQLTVSGGGQVLLSGLPPEGGYIWIGSRARGDVTVTGTDSALLANAQMTVGDGNKGTLTISAEGRARCSSLILGGYATPTTDGEITITGTGSHLTSDLCRIGSLGTGSIEVSAGATMTTNSQVQVGYEGSGELNITSGAQVDSHKGTSPTNSSGILAAQANGNGVVTVSGANSKWIQDGVMTVGWFGGGTLNIESGGAIESVDGIVARAGGSTGTATVTGSNSKWAISGSLSVGGMMDAAGGAGTLSVTSQGLITVGAALRVWAGSSVTLGAGRAVVGTGEVPAGEGVLAVYAGGTVSGTGTLTANVVNSGGVVAPGASPGTLQVNGSYIQSGTGSLSVEIGGTSAGQFDSLVVNGSAITGGALTVSLVDGFVPAVGNTFEILHATTRTGTFDQVTGPTGIGVRFVPTYTSQSVILTVESSLGPDLDQDGDVDLADLDMFKPCATGPEVPYVPGALPQGCRLTPDAQNRIAADFDRDGDVDTDDFGVLQSSWTGPKCTTFSGADFNHDCSVDGTDRATFNACTTGFDIPYDPDALPPGCNLTPDPQGHIAADFNEDGDVDMDDFGVFQLCYSGPGRHADPNCGN